MFAIADVVNIIVGARAVVVTAAIGIVVDLASAAVVVAAVVVVSDVANKSEEIFLK